MTFSCVMSMQEFLLDGKSAMADPMSLIDYPVKANETAKIKVVLGEAPKEEVGATSTVEEEKDDLEDGEEFEPLSPLEVPKAEKKA